MSKKSGTDWLSSVVSTLKVQDAGTVGTPTEPIQGFGRVKVLRSVAKHTEERRREIKKMLDQRNRITLTGMLRQLRKQCAYRAKHQTGCYDLEITLAEWKALWEGAGGVYFQGHMVPAWQARVLRKRNTDSVKYDLTDGAELVRLDLSKPFRLDNLKIVYQRRTLVRGKDVKL